MASHTLPHGLPVMDAPPDLTNVLLAFGPAHTGMVGARQTGRLITQLATDEPGNFDLTPFRASRFGF